MVAGLLPPFSNGCSLLDNLVPVHGHKQLPGETVLQESEVLAHLTTELDVSRLNRIHEHLWIAGSKSNIRPLHCQRMRQRSMVVTERTDLHLVWWGSVILIKPLPPFLLSYDFFKNELCSTDVPDGHYSTLHASACGLLQSYNHLVTHQSDFNIALELGLLPKGITWKQWTTFATSLRANLKAPGPNGEPLVNKRYHYGELRRTRLNLIYRFVCHRWARGYYYVYTEYQPLFETNFAWLLLAFAYISIILSAMQVGLSTTIGQTKTPFVKASYGFAIASLAAVIGVVGLMVLLLGGLFLNNLIFALANEKKKSKRRGGDG